MHGRPVRSEKRSGLYSGYLDMRGGTMSALAKNPNRPALREYVPGELRCAAFPARLAALAHGDWASIAEAAWDSPSWKEAAREYHANRQPRRDPDDPGIVRGRRRLADDVSIERAWHEINAARLHGQAAETTVEALMYSLRKGTEALKNPDAQRRLSALSKAQLREVCGRLQNFEPHIAPAWTPKEVKVLVAIWRQIHGR
jgi:hypothetical protein